MRVVFALFTMLCVLVTLPASAAQPRKLALVIGNDLYQNFVPLERAVADSRAYRDMLQNTRGFEVFYAENANRAASFQKIFQFISNIRPGDTAMVVYSGHGVQLDPDRRDSLFLLPTDIPNVDPGIGAEEAFLSANGIRFSDISQWVRERGAKLSIFVLDACRDNPFTGRGGTRSVGLSRGLGLVNASEGEFVFFAAAPGEVALDRLPYGDTNPNSVFTRAFLKHFQPNTYLEDVANNVQEEVLELSRQANLRQAPYYTDGVAGKACIDATCSVPRIADPVAEKAPEPTTALTADVEETFWRLCETRDNPAYCEAYIQQYPEGPRALLAEVRLNEMRLSREAEAAEVAEETRASRREIEKAEAAAKAAADEQRRQNDAAELQAALEARKRAEDEAQALREAQEAKLAQLEEELAARREAEAEAARLLAQLEAKREAQSVAESAVSQTRAPEPEEDVNVLARLSPETIAETKPGFVPAPRPSASVAEEDGEANKGLVIAALPSTVNAEDVAPEEPAATPEDAVGLTPALSDADRRRAQEWEALADSFDSAALTAFAAANPDTVQGAAATARLQKLRDLLREGQRQLNRVGYWAGTPDGIWGPRSTRALRKFQRDNDLQETGVLTNALMARLKELPTKRQASRPATTAASRPASQAEPQPVVTVPETTVAETPAPTPAEPAAQPSPVPDDDFEPFGGHSSM
ncbi:MAG: caspase family protein [Pseudomonadota bacterium]